jgi:hypothetical protein
MRGFPRMLVVGLAFAACMVGPLAGHAQAGAPLTLVWAAPDACPQEAEFRAQIERFLRQSLSERREQSVAIAGTVRELQSGDFQLLLRVQTARGNQGRDLSHRDCHELVEAGALVSALAIDPSVAVESAPDALTLPEPAPAPAPAPATSEPVALPSLPAPAAPLSPPRRPPPATSGGAKSLTARLHPSLLALGFAGNAALPDVGVGFGARAAAGPGRLRLVLRGSYWLERFLPVDQSSGSGVALSAWAVGLRACGEPVTGSISFWACVGVDGGQVKAKGKELEDGRTARDRWNAVTAELAAVHVAASGLTTQLGFELGRGLERPRFSVAFDGRERQVFEANPWIAQVSLGVGFSFGRGK